MHDPHVNTSGKDGKPAITDQQQSLSHTATQCLAKLAEIRELQDQAQCVAIAARSYGELREGAGDEMDCILMTVIRAMIDMLSDVTAFREIENRLQPLVREGA